MHKFYQNAISSINFAFPSLQGGIFPCSLTLPFTFRKLDAGCLLNWWTFENLVKKYMLSHFKRCLRSYELNVWILKMFNIDWSYSVSASYFKVRFLIIPIDFLQEANVIFGELKAVNEILETNVELSKGKKRGCTYRTLVLELGTNLCSKYCWEKIKQLPPLSFMKYELDIYWHYIINIQLFADQHKSSERVTFEFSEMWPNASY